MGKKSIGRNDPCWCGSGKKYKKCHLGREEAAPLPYHQTAREFNRLRKGDGKCLYPVRDAPCNAPTIEAHSISRSAALLKIARSGQVYQPNLDPFRIAAEKGSIKHTLVGINRATTFTGFCNDHDSELFREIDVGELVPTPKQAFLLHYRALCRELYAKRPMVQARLALRDADRGRPASVQQTIQRFVTETAASMQRSVRELEDNKATCDSGLPANDYSRLRGCALRFSKIPTVACSGYTQPVYDFAANELQDLGDFSRDMSQMSFNLLPDSNGGIAVFVWLDDHDAVCRRFAESLIALPDDRKSDALVQYVFDSFENHAINPAWWEALSAEARKDIDERGTNWAGGFLIDTAALIPSSIFRFADWEYEGVKWLPSSD